MTLPLELLPNPALQGPNDAMNLGDVLPIILAMIVFVVGPISIAVARVIWSRGKAAPPLEPTHEIRAQLQQLQQSVDTLAIETERISEGQRFVAKILADRGIEQPALPSNSPPTGVKRAKAS
jgi:hypothetical protein